MAHTLMDALVIVFSIGGLSCIVIGVLVGIFVGAMPGLGPSIGIALLIPFTYGLSTSYSLLLLVSLYMAAEYGGSISAILIATPGTSAAAATVLDGYPLRQKGFPGLALGISLSASSVGGLIGTLALILFAQPLAEVALRFGPPAYFAIGLFGLTTVASLSAESPIKGLLVACFGLAIATIGIDPISGAPRFAFGQMELFEGVPFLTALIGLFALSEAFGMAERKITKRKVDERVGHILLSLRQWRDLLPTMMSGSIIGTILGIVPGVGGNIACWLAYDRARKRSKHPESFGTGEPKGIAAPEAANNATVGGAMIPLLSLGVPGSPTTAVLMGALILHGVRPGPQLFTEAPDMIYALFIGLAVCVAVMFLIGSFTLSWWARLMSVSDSVLVVVICVLSTVGAFSLRSLMFDVYVTVGFGVLGYILKKFRFPMPPIVLAMVLGYLVESNFRTALLMSQGSYAIFFEDWLCLLFIVLSVGTFVWPLLKQRVARVLGFNTTK
ncbi:tripartite tricarboxylate transporter permease [Shumkonia mesophila]|uniref:tripartite tricarboxylate transporter permease n=1 Tax=Shumkonia mesophila TaxID=2838854 RepID=UPI0029349D6D|nr:tripartite tricarboxylate transporter permease [Shumkonia mesophila]